MLFVNLESDEQTRTGGISYIREKRCGWLYTRLMRVGEGREDGGWRMEAVQGASSRTKFEVRFCLVVA
jgi:hypothetical protein